MELRDLAPTLLQLADVEAPKGMSASSLLPILTGDADPSVHRQAVRSEYYHTLSPQGGFKGSYATMVRTRRFKLVVYHELDRGELLDLQQDPGEFENLWDDPTHCQIRFELLKQMMDQLAHAINIGPEQVAAF